MPVVTEHLLGEPCWADLMSSDPARSRDFYTALFGWSAEDSGDEYGNYITFSKNGQIVAGLGGAMGGVEASNAWTVYLKVADADASEAAVTAHGGQIYAPAMTVGDQGRMVVAADPSGAVFGIWQTLAHTGFGLAGEAGAPVWHELNTRDLDAAVAFYTDVFGWDPQTLSDSPDFRYVTFGSGGAGGPDSRAGGVYDASATLPDGVPSHWQVYFGIDDVDAGARRVAELGGTVVREPWDSEFGRFAQVSDPTGGTFLLSSVEDTASA